MTLPGQPELSAAPTPAPVLRRLDAVDFFRGLALTMVLLNHLDWASGRKLFRLITPVGLGFSDGAEAFVFLSGLTFGWVYSARLQREGFRPNAVKVLRRAVQIYLGYAFCVLLLTAFSALPVGMTDWSRNPLRIESGDTLVAALLRTLTLQQSPFALGILGLYIVILPLMLPLLALAQRSLWLALAVSTALYVAVQPPLGWDAASSQWFGGWLFHPLAWQLIFVLGMLIGVHLRRGEASFPRHAWLILLAGAVLLYGLVSAKRDVIATVTGWSEPDFWRWFDLSQSWLIDKPRVGPLRIVHFAAVAYLIACCVPATYGWRSAWARPFINTGRHSLPLYCCGTLMVYAVAIPLHEFGNSAQVVMILGLDACLLQFLIAWWLERRKAMRAPSAA